SPAARFCYAQTDCTVPCVRADWFVFAASRPPLYHALLKLPETDRELENKLRIDVQANVRDGKAVRAGFSRSGVALHNRLIERHDLAHGAYLWKTYDFARSQGRQNLFQHPLGPGTDEDTFQHSGSEIIFSLPNDLQAYMLVDAKGNRIEEGPIELVVADPRQGLGPKVINGISCMSCHTHGIIAKADEIRAEVAKTRGAAKTEDVLALYPTQDKLAEFFHDDAAHFAAAVKKTGAAPGKTEPIAALALRYGWELDRNLAAAEAGVEFKALDEELRKDSPRLAGLAPLRSEGGTIPRQVFDDTFDELIRVLRRGVSRPKRDVVVNSITLWNRIGEERLKKVIDDFVPAMLADPKVNFDRGGKYKFTPEKITKLKTDLLHMASQVSGGPYKYEGNDMLTIHKGMGITGDEFDALVGHLQKALDANGVKLADQTIFLAPVLSKRKDIVEK